MAAAAPAPTAAAAPPAPSYAPLTTLHSLFATEAGDAAAPALMVAGDADAPTSLEWSYAQLAAEVRSLQLQLQAAGVGAGDVVSLSLVNSAELVAAFLAVTFARASAAPLNPAYTQDEVAFYLEDTEARLLVLPADADNAHPARAAARALNVPVCTVELFTDDDDDASTTSPARCRRRVRLVNVPDAVAKRAVLAADADERTVPRVASVDDVALFLHTSGTTSRPKGVPLRHSNVARSLDNIRRCYELSPADRSLIVMPLFHVHGLIGATLSTLAAHGCAVVQPTRFSASAFWADFARHACTWYSAVPTIHSILLARLQSGAEASAGNVPLPTLRFIRSCSSSLAPSVLDALERAFAAPVLEAYGMTEACHQMTSSPLPHHGRRTPGSVGRGTGVEVAIVDEREERLLATGELGEVCVRGANVTHGYHNNAAANAANFTNPGRWFRTGDQGRLDADGYLTLTGRIKELINRGGEKISPIELDATMLQHDAVAEAVAFAVPHDKYGEEVAAAVVFKEARRAAPPPAAADDDAAQAAHTEQLKQELLAFLAERLASFKVPKTLYVSTFMPKTATGKIQRRKVREHFTGK